MVYVEGWLQTRKWKDKNDVDRYVTEIVASAVQNLSPRPDSGSSEGGYGQPFLHPEPFGYGGGGISKDVPF